MTVDQSRQQTTAPAAVVAPVALAALSAISLVWPLVTPVIAVAGSVTAYLARRRNPNAWLTVALVVSLVALAFALVIDLVLLNAGVVAGQAHRV